MIVDYLIGELINYKGLNCYDGCIVTYINNSKLPHEHLYNKFWIETDFQYDAENHCFISSIFSENLYSYFGIKILLKDDFGEQSIFELINTYHIFMVKTDLFYYPYSASFHIRHAPHYFLVHGYDTHKKCIYLSDPSQGVHCESMDILDFMNIYKEVLVFCREAVDEEMIILLKNKKELEISYDELTRKLDDIECRLEGIFKSEDISEELLYRGGLYFNRLASNRFCYLKYLDSYYLSEQEVFKHTDKFLRIGKKYDTIKNMLYKCMSMKKCVQLCENIIKFYKEVAIEEQEMVSILINEQRFMKGEIVENRRSDRILW